MRSTWMVVIAAVGATAGVVIAPRPASPEVNKVESIAPDVYFHEGDLEKSGHCNNGWIVFDDYVLVIDANFPSGAELIIPKIRSITSKPIRFAFDTHHHGDHAYGNQVWVNNGATPVAHTGVVEELRKYEPQRWNETAKEPNRTDVAASKLKYPTLLFPDRMIFDDGRHRVELVHLGVAHTHGDGFAWLPKERILFTGDACVNGPYNFVGDGDTAAWVKTLEAARSLGATIVGPGHGPLGKGSLLGDQQTYFIELRKAVKKLVDARKSGPDVNAAIPNIQSALKGNPQIARYVGTFFPAQVEKVFVEMGGKPFLPQKAELESHTLHADAHGLSLLWPSPPWLGTRAGTRSR